MLLDRYRKAGNFNRPWLLAVSYSGAALRGPPEGDARRWWENAYPRAYRDLVEQHQALGENPDGYLYSIMRKESGFNPHDLSYADAQGLLQMIPATTRRVVEAARHPVRPRAGSTSPRTTSRPGAGTSATCCRSSRARSRSAPARSTAARAR